MCLDFIQNLFYGEPEKKGLDTEELDKVRQIRIEKYKDTKIMKTIKKNRKKKEAEEKKENEYAMARNNQIIKDWIK